MWWLLVVTLLVAGCPPPAKYAVERPGLDCERATRVAHRTLVAMGYTITNLVPASAARAGVVAGTKVGADGRQQGGKVVVSCSASGAVVQPVEEGIVPGDYEFSRGFDYSFTTLVQRPDVESPWKNVGLQVLVQAMDVYEARLDLGGAATEGGAVPVRVTVRNATDRAVRLDVARLSLVDAEGGSSEPLTGAALEAALARSAAGDRLRADLFAASPIKGGETRVGFLVYPPGQYREARVAVEDVQTGETEGFVAPVE